MEMECAGKWMCADGFADGGSGCMQVFVILLAAVTTHRNRESISSRCKVQLNHNAQPLHIEWC